MTTPNILQVILNTTDNDNISSSKLRGEEASALQPESNKMTTQKRTTTTMRHHEQESTSQMADENHSLDANPRMTPLPSLPSCPSLWQVLNSRVRSGRKQVADNSNRSVCDNNSSFSGTKRPPLLPDTTIISEILPFCDDSTLVAFRGVSKQFRDLEIPREFHERAMTKINSQKRQQKLLAGVLSDAARYSYKKKIMDEGNRKVLLFLRENSGEKQTETSNNEIGNDHSLPEDNTFDSDSWTLQKVTSKVLKMIRDVEFYNGSVHGYDQKRAKKLLLEKGWIDERDFQRPSLSVRSLLKKNLFGTHQEYDYPVYGKWRAEASVREVSLNEALEILSRNSSMTDGGCNTKRWWKNPFRRQNDKQSDDEESSVQNSKYPDSDDENLGLSILLSCSSSASGGIRLAEYSTVFEKTKISCSILLVRTRDGAEAEVRVLSGRDEQDFKRSPWSSFRSQSSGKGLSLSRHSTNSI